MVKIYPFVSSKIEKIPYNLGNLIYYILLVVITIDMFISFSACIRMGLRHEGYKPLTGYGEFLDKVYKDLHLSEIVMHTANKSDDKYQKIEKYYYCGPQGYRIEMYFMHLQHHSGPI